MKVPGKNRKHNVVLYALSTCMWCQLTKKFLKDSGVAYEYIDIDLCSDDDKKKIMKDILSKGGRPAYPVVIVDDGTPIIGYHEDKLREALKL